MEKICFLRIKFLLLVIIFASRNESLDAIPTLVGSKYQIECTMCSTCDNPCNTPSPPPPPPPPPPPTAATCACPPPLSPPPNSGENYNSPPTSGGAAYNYNPPPAYLTGQAVPPPPNPIVPYFPYYYYSPPPPSSSSVPSFKKIPLSFLIVTLLVNLYHFTFPWSMRLRR